NFPWRFRESAHWTAGGNCIFTSGKKYTYRRRIDPATLLYFRYEHDPHSARRQRREYFQSSFSTRLSTCKTVWVERAKNHCSCCFAESVADKRCNDNHTLRAYFRANSRSIHCTGSGVIAAAGFSRTYQDAITLKSTLRISSTSPF